MFSGPFLNDEHLKNSSYSPEEIFHPTSLKKLIDPSKYDFKQQYASYYGLCYVIQKLTPEGLSDYSSEIAINAQIDYNVMLHEPDENEWLYMSVYPYEIHLKHININNTNNQGGASKDSYVFLKKVKLDNETFHRHLLTDMK